MTDEAMTMAADTPAASEPQTTPDTTQPSEPRDTSARGAIERAFAAVDARSNEDAPEPVADKQPAERKRAADGKFEAATEQVEVTENDDDRSAAEATPAAGKFEPPSRFSPDAKAAWSDVPAPVKAEVDRAFREMEGGIAKYREAFEPYREFDEQLRQSGQDFNQVIAHYTGIEGLLAQDPIAGLDRICRNLGTDIQSVAAHIMGQPVDQMQQQQTAYTRDLEQKIAELQQQIMGVSTHIRTQTQDQINRQVAEFAQSHPRMDELAPDIVFFLESGKADDLQKAYELAERLNPAPAPAPAAAAPTAEPAQTRKGKLSLSGAPGTGSNPATRKTPATARDAIDNAFARVGLG